MAYILVFLVTSVLLTASNYRKSDAIQRRQLRWVAFGFYAATAPPALATALELTSGLLFGDWRRFHPLIWPSFNATVLIPLSFLVAIVRHDLFDIDRLISATAAYNAVLVVAAGAGLAMVPPIGDLASSVAGIDPRAGRTAVAVLIAAIAVPVAQRLRPRIDRIFFGERLALEHGTADLLRSLAGTDDCDALLKVAGEELHRLLQPRACAVYARTARNEFESAFVAGRATPVAVPGVSPLVATLGQLHRPLALEAPPRRSHTSALDPFARAALEALGAAVVVPVVVGDALAAFVCLGPKRSGDIYTATDLAHLASIAQTMVDQLRRFASEAAAAEQGGVFRREGDIWTIAYAGKEVRLRDMRGFHYLAALLREPGRELHASQLVGGKHGAPPAPIEQEGLHVGYGAGVAGERMDAKARAAYKARIAELHDAIAEAERLNDRGRLERASHEREALLVELGAAARGQRTGSDAERARLTATKGTKAALDKIAVSHPELGAHLQATVRRGYFCSYQPDPRHPIEWEL